MDCINKKNWCPLCSVLLLISSSFICCQKSEYDTQDESIYTVWKCMPKEACWYYSKYTDKQLLDDYTEITKCSPDGKKILCPPAIIGGQFCQVVKNLNGSECISKSDCWHYQQTTGRLPGYEHDIRCSYSDKKMCCAPREIISLDGDKFCQNLKNSTMWTCQKSESCWYYTQYKNENRLDDYTPIQHCGSSENFICCPREVVGDPFCQEVKNFSRWKCIRKSECSYYDATKNQNIADDDGRAIKCSHADDEMCCPLKNSATSLDGDKFCQNLKNSAMWTCLKSESCWYYKQYKNENRLDDYTPIEPCGRQENSICCPKKIIGPRFCENVKNLSGWKCVSKSDCEKGATKNQNISSIYERDIKCTISPYKKCCPPPTPKPEPPPSETSFPERYYNSIEIASKIIEQECAKLGINASNSNKCEKKIYGFEFIVNGFNADEKEFPHQAVIGTEHNKVIEWKCGGSLISERFVLSAVYCAYNGTGYEPKLVLLGATKLLPMDQNTNAVNYSIVEWIFHPDHDERFKIADIVLFKLNDTVKFNAYVRPICLATLSSFLPPKATVTEYGKLITDSEMSIILLRKHVSIADSQYCIDRVNKNAEFSHPTNKSRIICIGYEDGGLYLCYGDVGGPMQIKTESCLYELHGVVSGGSYFCVDGNATYAIYTKVSAYLDWIQYNVWPNRTIR